MGLERVIENRALVWSGEHWIAYLREQDDAPDNGRVSLYHIRFSGAGEGKVAFVDIPRETGGLIGIYTDNQDVAQFVIEHVVRGNSNNPYYDHELSIVDASINQVGDIRTDPSWEIEAGDDKVVVTWTSIHPALILEGPGPFIKGASVTHSILFFTNEATITLNGALTGGVPYVRSEWMPAIGRQGMSTVFAISETTTSVSSS